MRCAACGAERIPGTRDCPACGAAAARCPRCDAELGAGYRFCPDCGLAVGADGEPAPRAAGRVAPPAARVRAARGVVEGERKQVTVLFCDLSGSTAIAERLDPEEYRDLLDRYLEVVFREIYRFDGVVNQLAGDGLMALFGAPVAHEDAPRRAVRAALAIQQTLGEQGLELRARIGVHTGPVVVGPVGTDLEMEYTAVGDTTNLAARLEALAPPGGVLISEATHRLVRGFFEVRPAGPFETTGTGQRLVAWEVRGRSAAETAMAVAVERGLTPFVGRQEELAQLTACHARVGGNGAQVVAVVGEAGSGKSRLLYEFTERLAAAGTVVFSGRCSSMGQAVPYHPFMSMFRRYFDLGPGDSAAVACEKVAARVGIGHERLERTYPLLHRFLCLTGPEPQDLPRSELKHESFDALARLVLAESARAPVVVTIEDLHWVDEPSRELLDGLVVRLVNAPVLLVVTERPEGAAWRPRAAFTRLVLGRLADDDVATIVRAVAGGPLPKELEGRLLARAEGSPFVAEEMTRGLLEEGYLVGDGGQCRLSRPVEEIPIPGSVQEVLAARLDRLDPSAKRVIQVAAVLGRQFSRPQLARLLDGEGIDVARALAALEERGLLHRKSVASAEEYRFGESLTQEVAYEGLLHRQVRQLHERVGVLLEETPGEGGAERSALLAHHFSRSDNRPKAVEAFLRAARDAEQLPSWRAAVEFYRRAWEAAEAGAADETDSGGPFHGAVLDATTGLCRVSAIFGTADRDEAERAGRRGRELAEARGAAEARASLSYFHGVLTMLGEPDEFAPGLALAEQGLAFAREAGLTIPAMRISSGLAVNYALDGRFELAARAGGWVVEELERQGHRERCTDLYLGSRWIRDTVQLLGDDLDGAARSAAETHALALRAPNRTVRSASAFTLAQVHFLRGEYAEACRWAEENLEIAEAIANTAALPGAAAIALVARWEAGERVAPERYLDAIERGLAAGDSLQTNIRYLGDAFLVAGDLTRVERHAEALARNRSGGRLRQAFVAIALGGVLARLGRHAEAERAFTRALALAEVIGAGSALAAAAIGAAELARTRGAPAASTRQLEYALAVARRLRLGHYLARAHRLQPEAGAASDAPAPLP
jgi:class 3 adenylate cyclase/tetratricopeptide (TPR) repeat protein